MALPPGILPPGASDSEEAPAGGSLPPGILPETEEHKEQSHFTTPVQKAATTIEGLGDTLSLGAYSHLLNAVSPDAEANAQAMAAREKYNHGFRLAGEIGGALLPIGAPGAISKAGSLAARGAAALLPEATSVAGRLALGAAKGAASGAVEGGLFSAGNVVHEAAIGDPQEVAQHAISEIGLGSMLGLGGGAVLGTGGSALGELTKQATAGELGSKLSSWLEDVEGEANLKAAGMGSASRKGALKKMSEEALNKVGREAGELGLVDSFSSPSRSLEKSEALLDDAGGRMGGVLDTADATGAMPRDIETIANRARREVVKPMLDNPFEKASAAKVDGILSDFEQKFSDRGDEVPLTFRALHDVRKKISDELYGLKGNLDPGATYYKQALSQIRGIVSDELDRGLSKVKLDSDLAAVWKKANRDYHVAATIGDIAEKGAAKPAASPLEQMGMLAGVLHHGIPGGALMGLGSSVARRFGNNLLGAAARSVRGVLDKGAAEAVAGKTAEAISAEQAAGANTVAQQASSTPEAMAALSQLKKANDASTQKIERALRLVVGGARREVSSGAARAATSEHIANVVQLASNPELLQQRLTQQTADLQEHAPQTAQAMQIASVRAVNFLASKAPKLAPVAPLAPKPKLSTQEKWTFGRYQAAVNSPTSILTHAAAGTLTPMDVEAVRTVYPELYSSIQEQALSQVMGHKKELPYRSKLMLSMLLGHDLDGTLTPESIQSAQAIYAAPSAKGPADKTGPAATGKTTQTGLSKLKVGSRAMLPGQAAETRRDTG